MKLEMERRQLRAALDVVYTLMRGGGAGASNEALVETRDLALRTAHAALWRDGAGWETMVQSGMLQLTDGEVTAADLTKKSALSTSLGRVLLAIDILLPPFGEELMERLRFVAAGSLRLMGSVSTNILITEKIPHIRTELCDMQTPAPTCKAFMRIMAMLDVKDGDAILLDNAKRAFEFHRDHGRIEIENHTFDPETDTETIVRQLIDLCELSDVLQQRKDKAAQGIDLSSDESPDFAEIPDAGVSRKSVAAAAAAPPLPATPVAPVAVRLAEAPAGKIHGGDEKDDKDEIVDAPPLSREPVPTA